MGYIKNINYQETIKKKSIVFKLKWLDIIDTIVFVMTSLFFIVCLILTFREADLKSPNDSFVAYWILPFLMVFTLILLYKKIREKRLLVIETKLNKVEAREKIINIVKSWQWKLHYNNADYLLATTGIEIGSWGKQVIIIYADKKIYLNVMSNNPKIRMPVLFSDKSIKSEVEKTLKSQTQIKNGA